MRVFVTTATELGSDELELWRSFQRNNPAIETPYLAPELIKMQSVHDPRWRVVVLEDDGKVVGFLPIVQKSQWLAHVRAFMCNPGQEWDVRHVMEQIGASVFEFDYLVGGQVEQFNPRSHQLEAAPVADLAKGWEAWLKAKNAETSQLKSFARKTRKLSREVGEVELELRSDSHADLEEMMKWKSAQLIRTGRADRFADPHYRALFHDLLDNPQDHFAIHLSVLRAGEKRIGVHLTATSQHIASVWHTSYDPAEELDKYSPGMVMMVQHMEKANAAGITKIEFGKGFARYKELFKNYDEHVAEGWAERPTVRALARRIQQAPKRTAYKVVLGNPRLRVAARHTLNAIGEVRMKVSGKKVS